MTPEQAIAKFDRLLDNLDDLMRLEMETVVTDAKALVQRRVQQTGTDADGKPFEPYTEAYVNKRDEKGLPPFLVNLSFEGEMWRSIGLKEERTDGDSYIAVLGGRDTDTVNKIIWNVDKRPFMELNQQEVDLLVQISGPRFRNRIAEQLR